MGETGDKRSSQPQESRISDYRVAISLLRACPNRIEIVNRKSKSIRFRECFGRSVQAESKREHRKAAEKHGRAATYGPFKTMHTCRQSSARQHRSTRAAGTHNIPTPGGRWASHGGGAPMEVVARPALTPRVQTLNCTENELPASSSRASC